LNVSPTSRRQIALKLKYYAIHHVLTLLEQFKILIIILMINVKSKPQ